MARNKYPEITVEKILEVSQRLFREKGYDNTTIQDIVNELGGLTKGAIYHHFKSKDLNGLQKMREVIKINYEDTERAELSKRTLPVLKNPRILAGMIDTDRRLLAPLWQTLIEEGQADGSINTEYAKELSELIPLLSDLWLTPTTYPACEKEIMNRFNCMSAILDAMGIPLFNSELKELVEHRVEELLK